MTQQLEQQLNKLKIKYDVDGDCIYIHKQSPSDVLTFKKNHFYIIEIDQGDVAKKLMEITTMNWNQGRRIVSPILKCEFVQSLGNMTQLNASGYDMEHDIDLPDVYLNIWVNSNIIKIIDEIK